MTQLSPPTVRFRALNRPVYHRPGWVQAASGHLPEAWRGPRVERWIMRLPMLGLALAFAGLTFAVDTTTPSVAEVDEILRALPAGASVHPALATALDGVGGLAAVRVASVLAAAAAIVLLGGAVRIGTGSERTGVLAAALVATAPAVVVAGGTGTGTAWGLLALALAIRAGVGRSVGSAVGCGAALALAVTLVPAVLVLLPAVVALLALLAPRRDAVRPLLAFGTVVVLVGVVRLAAGLRPPFTVDGAGDRLGGIALGAGLVAVLAIAGAALVGPRARAGIAVGAALVLPLLADWSGTAPSARPAAAFAALLLAPVGALALAAASRRLLRWVPVAALLLVAPVLAVAESSYMAHGWVDVRPVAAIAPEPGADAGRVRLSTAADALRYETAAPGVRWESTAALAATGPDAVRAAVADRRFSLVLLQPTTAADADRTVLVAALDLSADYVREAPVPDAYDPLATWTVYRLIDTLP
ncbi:hypothetical protein GCM10009836_65090 [Pseudonocardia ailaonensis]|uniref:Glycosyltransferase RgtA/B/C/D-like domain-containing protein n=1 Tax=Pseudonocardia ailaonensis TaxID=367279 RepID=A0ABN2NPX6_9PSEU